MNYKFYALILTLTLAATPAMQAMRVTRGLLATARSLRPALQDGQHALAQIRSTHNNGHGYGQEEPRDAHGKYSIPAATAIAIGLGLTAQHAMEADDHNEENQEETPVSIADLSLYDFPGILEALQHASEEDKRLLTQEIARGMWHYKVSAIIKMLQCTEGRPHRNLVNGITKHITCYSTDDISQILKNDLHDDTHALIAHALKNNYKQFTNYTLCGVSLYSSQDWRKQYVTILKTLKPAYHGTMLQPILNDIEQHNIIDLIYVAGTSHKRDILIAFTNAQNIDLSVYNRGGELQDLLELTRPYNQLNIAHAIAKNIDLYNGHHFFYFLKICTQESRQIIANVIMQNLPKNINKYDTQTLDLIKQLCNNEQQETITTVAQLAIQSKGPMIVGYNELKGKFEAMRARTD